MDDKSKYPNMEPLDRSVEKLTWQLEERKEKHMQDIAHDSNWKPPKRSTTSQRNIANYGRVCKGSENAERHRSVCSTQKGNVKFNSGIVDFNSDSGASGNNLTTNNYASSEDTDEMLLRRNVCGSRVKSQAKIRSQRSQVQRITMDSSDDAEEVTSSITPKKKTKKAARNRKASISTSTYDSSGSSSGSNIAEGEITSLPKWLESESDSNDEPSAVVIQQNLKSTASSLQKSQKVVRESSKSSVASSDLQVDPTISRTLIQQNQLSNTLNLPKSQKIVLESSKCSVDESYSSDTDESDILEKTVLSPPDKTSTPLPKADQSQAKKRSHDSSVKHNSLVKRKVVMSKTSEPMTGMSNCNNLLIGEHYNEKILDEFSNGFQEATKQNNSSGEDELDIFEMIESGRIGKLYETVTSNHSHEKNTGISKLSDKQLSKLSVPAENSTKLELPVPQDCQDDKQKVHKKTNPLISETGPEHAARSKKEKKSAAKANVPCTAEKQKLSNQKRLDSLKQRQKENQLQKSALKRALSTVVGPIVMQ
jgi:hypothetical protein